MSAGNFVSGPENGCWTHPSWSPDGTRIAASLLNCYDELDEVFIRSYLFPVGKGRPRIIVGATPPVWSPDGRRIAFTSWRDGNSEVYVVNADGSGQRRLTRNTVRDSNPVWSPDGRIAFESHWQVWAMNADGSGQRRLSRNGGRNFAPARSPDGRRIAFERIGRGVIEHDPRWGAERGATRHRPAVTHDDRTNRDRCAVGYAR